MLSPLRQPCSLGVKILLSIIITITIIIIIIVIIITIIMEAEQRGAKKGCSGTMDNLLIDKMVTQDCHHGKRNLSMAWVDVTKAYDSVDHDWLCEMMEVHRFPRWLERVVTKLCSTWNTKIVTKIVKVRQGN